MRKAWILVTVQQWAVLCVCLWGSVLEASEEMRTALWFFFCAGLYRSFAFIRGATVMPLQLCRAVCSPLSFFKHSVIVYFLYESGRVYGALP
jgi:hypothetical protein